jgi:hypothetical protein
MAGRLSVSQMPKGRSRYYLAGQGANQGTMRLAVVAGGGSASASRISRSRSPFFGGTVDPDFLSSLFLSQGAPGWLGWSLRLPASRLDLPPRLPLALPTSSDGVLSGNSTYLSRAHQSIVRLRHVSYDWETVRCGSRTAQEERAGATVPRPLCLHLFVPPAGSLIFL